jgi:hypothetical protein
LESLDFKYNNFGANEDQINDFFSNLSKNQPQSPFMDNNKEVQNGQQESKFPICNFQSQNMGLQSPMLKKI